MRKFDYWFTVKVIILSAIMLVVMKAMTTAEITRRLGDIDARLNTVDFRLDELEE